MIAQLHGTLTTKDLDRIEVMTAGGVGYVLQIPLSVYEMLPKAGEPVTLHTLLVVKEDLWQLFGFASAYERRVFDLLLTANGVGPALAIGLLSTLTASRLVRAVVERDIPMLQSVPRVGRKKAERLILDLADKLRTVTPEGESAVPRPSGAHVDDAVRALVSLGYTIADADKAVRGALETVGGGAPAHELIRTALAKIGGRG